MTMITEEVNIDILEKKSDGTFIKKNPSTKISQVDGLTPTLEDKASKGYVDAKILAIDVTDLDLSGKVNANPSIPAGTATKVTYDTKGLVTGGANIVASDIPNLDTSKITTGTLAVSRIPSLDASKITTGTFNHPNRIPQLEISKTNGLQNALDKKFDKTGGDLTGNVIIRNAYPSLFLRSDTIARDFGDPNGVGHAVIGIRDKNYVNVGQINTFVDRIGGNRSWMNIQPMTEDENGNSVRGDFNFHISSNIGAYATMPMRADPGATDVVNTKYVLDRVAEMVDFVEEKADKGATINAGVNRITGVTEGWHRCSDYSATNLVTATGAGQNMRVWISHDEGTTAISVCNNTAPLTDNDVGYVTQTFMVPKNWHYRVQSTGKAGATVTVIEQPLTL